MKLTRLPIIMATANSQELKKIPMRMIRPVIGLFMKATSPIPLRTVSIVFMMIPYLFTQFLASGMVDIM